MNEFEKLVGKTIRTIEIVHPYFEDGESTDDESLKVTMTDGSVFTIHGTYGAYTGKSRDEYSERVFVKSWSDD